MPYLETLDPVQRDALTNMLSHANWFKNPTFITSTFDATTVRTSSLKKAIAKAKKLLTIQQKNPEKATLVDGVSVATVLECIAAIEKSKILHIADDIIMITKQAAESSGLVSEPAPPPEVPEVPEVPTVSDVPEVPDVEAGSKRPASASPPPAAKRCREESPVGFFKDLGAVLRL
jgi:hypothetical protein